MTRWHGLVGDSSGESYGRRFSDLETSGADIHGEARFCASLVRPPAKVLDAGCGTGRVAIKLDSFGYYVVGVDLDESMLAVARREGSALRWEVADLATFDLGEPFDLIILAGNIIPLLAPNSLPAVAQRLAAHLETGGLMATGFGFDAEHLPPGCPITPLADFDEACVAAGFTLRDRYATWSRGPFSPEAGYAVSVHCL